MRCVLAAQPLALSVLQRSAWMALADGRCPQGAAGEAHPFVVMLDEGSDYTSVFRFERATAERYAAIVVGPWNAWADLPDRVVAG